MLNRPGNYAKQHEKSFIIIRTLFEKLHTWLADFKWPAINQWRQFFSVTNRPERHRLGILVASAIIGFVILGSQLYLSLTVVKPDYAGSINVAIVGTPRFLNPALNQINDADKDLSAIIFSGLMKYNAQGKLVNDLAESYAIGENGKVYEITLKENILWQDEQPLTADDVIFTIQTIQNADFRSPIRSLWQGVEIEKISDRVVRFRLKNVYASFLNDLTFGILPKHLWSNVAASQFALSELNLKPIGSGPYQFNKLQKDKNGTIKSIELKAFADYFGGRPYINTITFYFYSSESEAFTAYKKGEADVFTFTSAKNFLELKSKESADYNIFSFSLPRYFAVFFNQSQNKFLADKTVRQALTLATDKTEIVNTIFGGYGQTASSPLLPGMTGYSDQTKSFNFDLEAAKNSLAAAGWADVDGDGFLEANKTNEKLEVVLTTIDWPELSKIAEILKTQWTKLGVKVTTDIKETDKIQSETIKPRLFQALLFGEVLGKEPDLFHFWHSSQKKDSGLNLALYDNSEVDKLLSQAIENLDKAAREQAYQKAVNIIVGDLPAIFLFNPDSLMIAQKDIMGIELKYLDLPATRFSEINHWYLETHRVFK
ncbi:MAG TPA: ABC transporter substrate-binding protein [Candidatus Portnoybacteria bacterium]|nr:ABC transporter substrate-binding protein [Candidatus Portnoybacteria bacterium]